MILGTVLFNIKMWDLFFIVASSDIANYADDTTPCECDQNYDKLMDILELTAIHKSFNFLLC